LLYDCILANWIFRELDTGTSMAVSKMTGLFSGAGPRFPLYLALILTLEVRIKE
jgi:hypothetical protein